MSAFLLTSCSNDNQISFCEGMDEEGNGVKCGEKFTTGELTAIINYKKPFNSEKLEIKISKISGSELIKTDSLDVKIKGDETKKSFNLQMYNAGTFKVDACIKNEIISTGTISLQD